MKGHTIISVAAKAASEQGALAGYEVKCSCGYVASTSLSAHEAQNLGAGHLAWAAKKAG